MIYDLPTSIELGGTEYPIRSDYRAILDIVMALSDPEIEEWERIYSAVCAFYVEFSSIPLEYEQEAVKKCFWFINGGEDEDPGPRQPRLVDWEQDFQLICAPVNRVLGKEVRALEYLHWWSFLSAYHEIGGDCTFAQVVSIRDKLATAMPLVFRRLCSLRKSRLCITPKTVLRPGHIILPWQSRAGIQRTTGKTISLRLRKHYRLAARSV